jgi:hypothetical protein
LCISISFSSKRLPSLLIVYYKNYEWNARIKTNISIAQNEVKKEEGRGSCAALKLEKIGKKQLGYD